MESIPKREINIKKGLYCILFSLLIGIICDRLFFEKALGISYFIFITLCIVFFMWSIKEKLKVQKTMGWFLLIPIGLLAFSYTVYTNEVFMVLNFLLVPFLMIVSSILIYNPKIEWDKITILFHVLKKGVVSVLENIGDPFIIIVRAIKARNKVQVKESKKQVITGLLISLPLLAVIVMLLSSADMVFNYYLRNITKVFDNIDISRFVPHIMLISFVFLYIFGYIWAFYKEEKERSEELNLQPVNWEAITIITVMVVLNIIYLLFTVIQFSYLYGGGNMTLPANFTYAEYARRGFFELAAVTFINFVIVLSCTKFIKREDKRHLNIANILFAILILFTLNMLYSANLKLSLYEGSYGFTYLRVFVHIFMILLFILSLIVLAGIWYRKIPVMKAIIITTIVMYTIVNYVNIDAFIARKNIERFYSTGKLDVHYLNSLSYEAVPYIMEIKNVEDVIDIREIRDGINKKRNNLDRLESWQEFNFSKNKVRNLLKN